MTQRLLCLEKPTPDDAADALAIAICSAHCSSVEKIRQKVEVKMIGFCGELWISCNKKSVFWSVQGVGYRVFVPASTRDKLSCPVQRSNSIYLNVREDALLLFGFATPEKEHEMFLLLLNVTGVGPKMALAILSGMKPEGIQYHLAAQRSSSLDPDFRCRQKNAEESFWNCGIKSVRLGLPLLWTRAAVLRQPTPVRRLFNRQWRPAVGISAGEILPRLRQLSGAEMTANSFVRYCRNQAEVRRRKRTVISGGAGG